MRLQESFADAVTEFVDESVRRVTLIFKEEFARQRVAVRVQPNRRQTQHDVSRRDCFSVNSLFSIDDAHNKTGNIIFTVRIEARHLSRFTAEQDAAVLATTAGDTFDDVGDRVRRKLARSNVIEKEKRPRALYQNIVDTVVDEIASDRGVNSGGESNLQFRADAVCGSNQHRLVQVWERTIEHAAEAANLGQRACIKCRAREFFNFFSGAVSGVDVDAGVSIGNSFHHEL